MCETNLLVFWVGHFRMQRTSSDKKRLNLWDSTQSRCDWVKPIGAVHIWRHAPRGEGGPTSVTICDDGGRGVFENMTSHKQKNNTSALYQRTCKNFTVSLKKVLQNCIYTSLLGYIALWYIAYYMHIVMYYWPTLINNKGSTPVKLLPLLLIR